MSPFKCASKDICGVCVAGCNFSLSSERCTGSCPHQIRFWSPVHLISLPLFKPIQTWITQIISVYYIDRWHVDLPVCSPSPAYSPGPCHTKPHDCCLVIGWWWCNGVWWKKQHDLRRMRETDLLSLISITGMTLIIKRKTAQKQKKIKIF